MYGWITARRIKEGQLDEFLRAWQEPEGSLPFKLPGDGGPVLFSLHPTDDPREVWTFAFFDSPDAMMRFRESGEYQRHLEQLEPYVEETLWQRFFDARPWQRPSKPLYYAVYIKTMPHHLYHLAVLVPDAREAVRQADILMAEARASGCTDPEWTMRVYETIDEAPNTLPANAWHMPVPEHAG